MNTTQLQPRKRYGRRACGQTQTSVSLDETVYERAKEIARSKGTTVSALLEELVILDKKVMTPGVI